MRGTVLVLVALLAAGPALAGLPEGIAAMERRDYAAAMRELKPLADAGDAEAAFRVGTMQREGLGMAADPAAAAAMMRRAAEAGHARAALVLSAMLLAGSGVAPDPAQGLVWLRRAAERGDPQAQTVMGAMTEAGELGRRDMAAAIGWYRKAAAQGEADAAYRLGRIHREGRGVPRDDRAATDWFRQAAERGHRDAQFEYALALSRGTGIGRDPAAAARWWRDAAEAGHPEAQINLAVVTLKGDGVPADPAAAAGWYRRAAAQGYPQAQAGLADLLQRGIGAPADPVQAYYWFGVAARRFPKGPAQDAARKSQAALARQLDAEERERQDRRIRAFRARAEGAGAAATAPARGRRGAPAPRGGTGSGFFVDRTGHVLTNAHVVESCASVQVMVERAPRPARIVARDDRLDLALLKLDAAPAAVAAFRGDPPIRPGDGVVLVGYPLAGILAVEPNVTTGAVSALAGLRGDQRHLQLTAPAQPGNSGGPLLDMQGRVVGVLTSSLGAARGARADIQNVNFAIKAQLAQDFLRAHAVTPESSGRAGRRLDAADVGAIGAKIAVLVECRP